jgi:hypothetical protein
VREGGRRREKVGEGARRCEKVREGEKRADLTPSLPEEEEVRELLEDGPARLMDDTDDSEASVLQQAQAFGQRDLPPNVRTM